MNIFYLFSYSRQVDPKYLRDAKKKIVSLANAKFRKGLDASKILPVGINTLPFPAGDKTLEAQLPPVVIADSRGRNPFVPRDT